MMKLLNQDCLIVMDEIETDSIDLILCDLPYGTTDRHGLTKGDNRILKWDSVIPLSSLWEHYKRILNKKHGVVILTADQPFTSQLVMSNPEWFKYEWIWKKDKTTGFLLANSRPMKQTEDVLVFSPCGASPAAQKAGRAMTYNPQGLVAKTVTKKNSAKRLGKLLHNPEHMGKNNRLLHDSEYSQTHTNYPSEIIEFGLDPNPMHPTQKPVALMEYLIRTYSNEGDLVLDNAMGSGTTGVACKNTNRQFIGIELDKTYFDIAKKRIEETEKEEPKKLYPLQ